MTNSFTWKIGGEAGFGIMTTGLMFSKIAGRLGFSVFDNVFYPSLIRGGNNVYETRFSDKPIFSQEEKADLLIALNKETFEREKTLLKEKAGVVFDSEKTTISSDEWQKTGAVPLPVPFTKIIKETGGSLIMQNNVALGVSCALFGFEKEALLAVIKDNFSTKGEKIVLENQKLAQTGFDYAQKNLISQFGRKITPPRVENQLVVSGNEAVALGAIAADCGFYVAYPMSPSSGVLHYLAAKAEQTGMVVKHAEDEISVINMALGSSYAGVRSMVGTSGGGFSLMVEGLGLAGITETPLVIFEAQRPGPASGLPTFTEQSDLKFLVNASQGEFPRIILAPGDVSEAFYLTVEAFNLSDIYQTPVFILSDKYLGEAHQTVLPFDPAKISQNRGKIETSPKEDYLRYKDNKDGISPRAFPGSAGVCFLANSYEHEENGLSTEDPGERTKQVDKRNRKLQTYLANMPPPQVYGGKKADLTLICWGSTKGPVLQALSDLNFVHKGKSLNLIHLTHVWPLNTPVLTSLLSSSRRRLIIEGNSTGQLAGLIRENTGIVIEDRLLKYDGRPFYPEEVINKLDSLS